VRWQSQILTQVLPLHLATLDRGVPRPWDPGVPRPWDLGAVLLCPEVVLHPPLDQVVPQEEVLEVRPADQDPVHLYPGPRDRDPPA